MRRLIPVSGAGRRTLYLRMDSGCFLLLPVLCWWELSPAGLWQKVLCDGLSFFSMFQVSLSEMLKREKINPKESPTSIHLNVCHERNKTHPLMFRDAHTFYHSVKQVHSQWSLKAVISDHFCFPAVQRAFWVVYQLYSLFLSWLSTLLFVFILVCWSHYASPCLCPPFHIHGLWFIFSHSFCSQQTVV